MIGDVIRPFGDQSFGILISEEISEHRCYCLWSDGTISCIELKDYTSYGNFADLFLNSKKP